MTVIKVRSRRDGTDIDGTKTSSLLQRRELKKETRCITIYYNQCFLKLLSNFKIYIHIPADTKDVHESEIRCTHCILIIIF